MTDIGPSLSKLRRDWRDEGVVEVPTGMIARRVLYGAMVRLDIGQALTVERIGERLIRITNSTGPGAPVSRRTFVG